MPTLTKEQRNNARQYLGHVIQGQITRNRVVDQNQAVQQTLNALEAEQELFAQLEAEDEAPPAADPPAEEAPAGDPPADAQ